MEGKMNSETLAFNKLTFVRASFVGHDPLTLEIWTDDKRHLASLILYNDLWQVVFPPSDKDCRLIWDDMIDIFRCCSEFVAEEGVRLLKDKESTTRETIERMEKRFQPGSETSEVQQ
jgi:hypothetical protein